MSNDAAPKTQVVRQRYGLRIILCTLIVLAGISGFIALASLKKPPAEVRDTERPLKVKVEKIQAASIPVTITGYGQVRTVTAVDISAEVAGQVVAVHPRLRVGERIAADEVLFRIDDRNYVAAVAQGMAEVDQLAGVVARLEKQARIDTQRLKTLERNRELASAEFERVRKLFSEHQVGTRSSVDRGEQAYNAAVDQADQMAQAVALYPIRIQEARSSLAAAQARLQLARANLARCEVRAPFDGRLTLATVEQGQYVSPGPPRLRLADDRLLEIQVPLDSRDVRQWIRFASASEPVDQAWFGQPEPVDCRIRWSEDKEGHVWHGRLQRIVAYDEKTRTITVAVRIAAADAIAGNGDLPLVEGMFCAVEIPGQTLPQAFKVPRSAVSFKNTVFLAVAGRLKTVEVQVARLDGDHAYITGGLHEGDTVIVTRLVDPLENSLLEVLSDSAHPQMTNWPDISVARKI